MKKKAYAFFCVLMALLCAACLSIVNVSSGAEYVMAAGSQSIYRLDVAKARGSIYDCNLQPLVGEKKQNVAAVAPTIESIGALDQATEGEKRGYLANALENGKPFAMELSRKIKDSCINFFQVPERYSEEQLAPHVVGYVDGTGHGVTGVELAMDDLLGRSSGEVTVYYQVDALGRVIPGAEKKIVDTLEETKAGVVLTLDSKIQRLVQDASEKLEKGAVVVTEVPDGEIRALASVPGYSPNDVGSAAANEDSPLVNRAFSAYSPGSVFKLVTAAEELEEDSYGYDFTCTGSINAGGLMFHCINSTAHGRVNLSTALQKSCNCYFVAAARALGRQAVLGMAYNLGFGASQEFGRGLYTNTGVLPALEELDNARALANFSFGQGDLTVTPMQVAGMMNCIASGGTYSTLKLISGTADSSLNVTPVESAAERTVQVMERSTALRLQSYLEGVALYGTANPGAPGNCTAGIKTGTAQTGVYENGEELLHFWYSGYIEDENGPRYTVTVLREATPDDKGVTAQVFREIAEGIAEQYF